MRRSVGAALIVLGGSFGLISAFTSGGFFSAANAAGLFTAAANCSTRANPDCIASEAIILSSLHCGTGKGATYTVKVAGAGSNPKTVSINPSGCDLRDGAAAGLLWHGTLVAIDQPGHESVQTRQHPYWDLRIASLLLVMPLLAAAVLLSGAFLFLSEQTPDSVVRQAVANQPAPPRSVPPGLWRACLATVGWQAMTLWWLLGSVIAIAFAIANDWNPLLPMQIPLAFVLALPACLVLVVATTHAAAVRDITTSERRDVVVDSVRPIQGRGGPVGVKASYRLAGGEPATVSITAAEWAQVHEGTRISVLADPSTGRICRTLGLAGAR